MEKIIDTYNLWKPNQKNINLNRSVSSKEIDSVIKKSPIKENDHNHDQV